jgi:protein gp37
MAQDSAIEWTDATWNPVTGCTKISPGCKNCYAHRMARRLHAMGQVRYRNNFDVTLHPDLLQQPLRWSQARKIFVNSMSDLFHPDVPLEFIQAVFDVMGKAYWHTFQILTKRSERLAELAADISWHKNVWMGVSVESQQYVYRIEHLRKAPAQVRFLSVEPLLGPIPRLPLQGVHWVIVGGESGSGARSIDPQWVRKIRNRCVAQAVPFFFKQWGGTKKKLTGRTLDGRIWDEMPDSEPKRSRRVLG